MQPGCIPSPMVSLVGRSKPGCDLRPALSFKDLPVRFRAAAVRRRGVGGRVAAVIGAKVVAARGGCLR
jgi:hypothetical protein